MSDVPIRRLVLVGSVIVDIVLYVDALPERGGDVVASRSMTTAGGGFNVLSAAARQGLPSAYGGLVGTGPFGEQVRDALAAESVELLPALRRRTRTPGSASRWSRRRASGRSRRPSAPRPG